MEEGKWKMEDEHILSPQPEGWGVEAIGCSSPKATLCGDSPWLKMIKTTAFPVLLFGARAHTKGGRDADRTN
jgi:hypothetical protein